MRIGLGVGVGLSVGLGIGVGVSLGGRTGLRILGRGTRTLASIVAVLRARRGPCFAKLQALRCATLAAA